MSSEPKDFLGKILSVGDQVVFMRRSYRDLTRGTIKSMADKTCLISHFDSYGKGFVGETRQDFSQVIKIQSDDPY